MTRLAVVYYVALVTSLLLAFFGVERIHGQEEEYHSKLASVLNTQYTGAASPAVAKRPSHKYQFAFSMVGNGFLGIYGDSVAGRLSERGVFTRDATIYATSSGSLFSAAWCSGAKFSDIISGFREIIATCQNVTYCPVDALLGEAMTKFIPPPTSPKEGYPNCDHLTMSMTVTNGTCNPLELEFGVTGPSIFVSGKQLKTKDALIEVARNSGYIPGWSGLACSRQYKNHSVADGGFLANDYCFSKNGCVRIFAYPPSPGSPVTIYPGIRPGSILEWPIPFSQWKAASLNATILYPYVDAVIAFARADADYWFETYVKNQRHG